MSMNISRRSFMKGAAAASLAVAASTMLTGCDMPSFDFGGIFGGRSETIKLPGGETINIVLTGYGYDSWCSQARPEFKVVNNAGDTLQVAKTAQSSGYTLVPNVEYVGTTGGRASIDWTKSTLDDESIANTESYTGELILSMADAKNWTGIELTFTAYNRSGKVGEPVVFSFKK